MGHDITRQIFSKDAVYSLSSQITPTVILQKSNKKVLMTNLCALKQLIHMAVECDKHELDS